MGKGHRESLSCMLLSQDEAEGYDMGFALLYRVVNFSI